jgi:hypothetical protein
MENRPMNTTLGINVTSGLMEFEMVMDLDLAIVGFIITHMKDEKIIKPEITIAESISGLKNMLLYRTEENPLSIIIKEDYKDSYDNIYQELMDSYGQEIYDMVRPTDILSFVDSTYISKGLVNITINCKNEKEVSKINKISHNKYKTILNQNDMSFYDGLYIKYAKHIPKYQHIDKKHIYILNTMYNMKKTDTTYEVCPEVLLYAETNIIRLIDPYVDLSIPRVEDLLWAQFEQKQSTM